jgi:hypothetical protein
MSLKENQSEEAAILAVIDLEVKAAAEGNVKAYEAILAEMSCSCRRTVTRGRAQSFAPGYANSSKTVR